MSFSDINNRPIDFITIIRYKFRFFHVCCVSMVLVYWFKYTVVPSKGVERGRVR